MAAPGKPSPRAWTRDELLVAFNLYLRLPFGQLRHGNADVIDLAEQLGRTPSSVSMKLCNFAGLDPALAARGIRGLANASSADRAIFEEFAGDWPRLAIESEEARDRLGASAPGGAGLHPTTPSGAGLHPAGDAPPKPDDPATHRNADHPPRQVANLPHPGVRDGAAPDLAGRPTEAFATIRQRRLQSLFRAAVLAAYDNTCCISGIALPQLLQASHIVPWAASDDNARLDPRNGLSLSALHDRAFDRGLITLDEDLRVVLSATLRQTPRPSPVFRQALLEIEGHPIRPPTRWAPDPGALAWHRERVFAG